MRGIDGGSDGEDKNDYSLPYLDGGVVADGVIEKEFAHCDPGEEYVGY